MSSRLEIECDSWCVVRTLCRLHLLFWTKKGPFSIFFFFSNHGNPFFTETSIRSNWEMRHVLIFSYHPGSTWVGHTVEANQLCSPPPEGSNILEMKLSLHKIKLPLNWFQTQRCEQISVYSLRLDVCSFSDTPRALCQMGLLANSNYEIDGEREGD